MVLSRARALLRVAEVYGFLAGAFLNAFLSKGLKRLIAQERPMYAAREIAAVDAPSSASQLVQTAASGVMASAVDAAFFTADELGVSHPSPTAVLQSLPVPMPDLGHGMPSSHAMSLFYFAAYLALASAAIIFSHQHYDSRSEQPHPVILLLRRLLPDWMEASWDDGWGRSVLIGALYALVSLECYTRIRRRYHTWQQIVVGAGLGTVVGFVHHRWLMPIIREASRDVPSLQERSPAFIACFTVGMTALAAITLGQSTRATRGTLAGTSGVGGGSRASLCCFLSMSFRRAQHATGGEATPRNRVAMAARLKDALARPACRASSGICSD